jgi:hypothetical protein
MPMVLLVKHKQSPLISFQKKFINCRYNKKWPVRPWVQLLPLPKRWMYTVCNRSTQRPPNNLKERINNERRVRGIRKLPIMMVGETLKIRSLSICVTFARKTTRLTSSLSLWRPKIYWRNNSLMC